MKRATALVFLFLAAGGSATAAFQPGFGGYLALDYLWPRSGEGKGNFQNLLGGLKVSGELAARVPFAFSLRVSGIDRLEAQEAWAGYQFSDLVTLKAGLFLVPFGLYNRASLPHESLLIRRPLGVEDAYPDRWRDLGLVAEGRFGFLSYAAHFGNGLAESETAAGSQSFRDNNSDPGYGVRVAARAGESLEAAYSYAGGRYDDAGERRLTLQAVDVRWLSDGWSLLAEYDRADFENPGPFSEGRVEGWFAVGLLNLGRLQPIASWQESSVDDPYHGAGFGSGKAGAGLRSDRTRWTVGVRVVPAEGFFLKAEYASDRDKLADRRDKSFRLQLALSF
jgi:hypothetical protein